MGNFSVIENMYSIRKNKYCVLYSHSPNSWKNRTEAKEKCGRDKSCVGFYYDGIARISNQCVYSLVHPPVHIAEWMWDQASILYLKNGKLVEYFQ